MDTYTVLEKISEIHNQSSDCAKCVFTTKFKACPIWVMSSLYPDKNLLEQMVNFIEEQYTED